MKKLILSLMLVLGCSSPAIAEIKKSDHPVRGVVYGFVDGGNRYESIIYHCTRDGAKINCSFESKCLRFPDKKNTQNQDEFKKASPSERKKLKKEFKNLCKKINEIIPSANEFEKLSEFDKESFENFNQMCINNTDFELLLKLTDDLENNICRFTTSTWNSTFEKKAGGIWESSHIGEMFGGLVGFKKATVQTFIEEKPGFWNFTFEASYLGTPKDGKPLPNAYKDNYSWKEESPILLPCKYVRMDIL